MAAGLTALTRLAGMQGGTAHRTCQGADNGSQIEKSNSAHHDALYGRAPSASQVAAAALLDGKEVAEVSGAAP